jgi:putative transcriptional regulator
MTEPIFETRSFGPESRETSGAHKESERRAQGVEKTASWSVAASRALVHRVRWHTGLSQSEFAGVYGIDLDHLRALESGAVQPDQALVAYLTVIDRAPETVRSALQTC